MGNPGRSESSLSHFFLQISMKYDFNERLEASNPLFRKSECNNL